MLLKESTPYGLLEMYCINGVVCARCVNGCVCDWVPMFLFRVLLFYKAVLLSVISVISALIYCLWHTCT